MLEATNHWLIGHSTEDTAEVIVWQVSQTPNVTYFTNVNGTVCTRSEPGMFIVSRVHVPCTSVKIYDRTFLLFSDVFVTDWFKINITNYNYGVLKVSLHISSNGNSSSTTTPANGTLGGDIDVGVETETGYPILSADGVGLEGTANILQINAIYCNMTQ